MNIASVQRNYALLDTIKRLYAEPERLRLRDVALANVKRWKEEASATTAGATKERGTEELTIEVVPDDWGIATQRASKKYGTVFASLNMANAHMFGGGYLHGMVAQEENMFRRTDCHFSHPENLLQSKKVDLFEELKMLFERHYTPEERHLIDGLNADRNGEGRVYLDMKPRVCIKGNEDREKDDLGYDLLPENEIFPFYELRSAALDLRQYGDEAYGAYANVHSLKRHKSLTGEVMDHSNEMMEPWGMKAMRRKVRSQLETLRANGVRHAVLSAFGCGAFLNPAECVAKIYSEEIVKMKTDFDVIVFAVYYAGYGPDNFTPFLKEFQTFDSTTKEMKRT